jgi:hypothetical protein
MAGSPTGQSKAAALGDFLTLIGLALLMLHATPIRAPSQCMTLVLSVLDS